MPWTREKIDDELAKLEQRAPVILAGNPDDGDFWSAWAGEADSIVDNAGADDYDHVQARISCILGSLGVIPSDNEGESCAD